MKFKGFDDTAFLEEINRKYVKKIGRGAFLEALLEVILMVGHKDNQVSKDGLIYYLMDMMPVPMEFGEIAQFADDDILTNSGIEAKKAWVAKEEKNRVVMKKYMVITGSKYGTSAIFHDSFANAEKDRQAYVCMDGYIAQVYEFDEDTDEYQLVCE